MAGSACRLADACEEWPEEEEFEVNVRFIQELVTAHFEEQNRLIEEQNSKLFARVGKQLAEELKRLSEEKLGAEKKTD